MTHSPDEDRLVADLADRHGMSRDAVGAVLKALKSSGGRMAQFSHPEFGGMSQWSGGMTMVGDMFNDGLRTKLGAIAGELSEFLAKHPEESRPAAANTNDVSYTSRASSSGSNWWPEGLGRPHSTGAQNDMRYAIFDTRLVIDDHGQITVYDSSGHDISGIAQAQGSASTMTFTGRSGLVRVSDLKVLDAGR